MMMMIFMMQIGKKTKVIVPVHLYGQCANMEDILNIASENNLYVIEDCAQALGSSFTFKSGISKKAGTIGDIGCTSFFPSKNLGCFGDGGAIITDNKKLSSKIRMIANHGQKEKYVHKIIGVNSRLDTLQAAVLNIKLRYLDQYSQKRIQYASIYDDLLTGIDEVIIPKRYSKSDHVFHQYTLMIKNNKRDK